MKPNRPSAEEVPREVFLAAADAIGAHYTTKGWRYARSGPHLSKRFGNTLAKTHIGSSHRNEAGQVVDLHVNFTIDDNRHHEWRVAVGLSDWGQISARHLGHLADPPRWRQWNLADPTSRAATIADILATTDQLGMQYVEAVAAATNADPPDHDRLHRLLDPDVEVEYRLRFGDHAGAEAAIHGLLTDDGLRKTFLHAIGEYREGRGLHLHPVSLGDKLARIALVADLQVDE